MTTNVRRTLGFLGATVLATQLFGSTPSSAGSFPGSSGSFERPMPVTPVQKEVGRLFQQISAHAAVIGKHADQLKSFNRVGSRLSYGSHAAELTQAKKAINAMGADFRQLQEFRSSALPWQQSVIDRMEPLLAGLAGNATDAIERLNEERGKLSSAEYRNAVGNLSAYAEQARTLVSVNLEYAQAREKLNRLDAGPAEPAAKVPAGREAAGLSPKAVKSLEQRVQSALGRLPYYGVFDHLAFQAQGDQVRLTGEVSWPALKADAEQAVRGVEGVTGVRNEIKVLPVSLHDNQIRLATYWAIYGDPTLARYRLNPNPPIRIIVENGHVTLKGTVGNAMNRTIAYTQANGVPGVFSVTNHLQVGS